MPLGGSLLYFLQLSLIVRAMGADNATDDLGSSLYNTTDEASLLTFFQLVGIMRSDSATDDLGGCLHDAANDAPLLQTLKINFTARINEDSDCGTAPETTNVDFL
jgi:hypothetical protein